MTAMTMRRDDAEQAGGITRLRHDVFDAEVPRDGSGALVSAADENERNACDVGQLLLAPPQFGSVHDGHHQVDDHRARHLGLQDGECLATVFRHADVVAFPLEPGDHVASGIGVIFDEKDCR